MKILFVMALTLLFASNAFSEKQDMRKPQQQKSEKPTQSIQFVKLPVDTEGNIYFEKIFEFSGKRKKELYDSALSWVLKTYNNVSNDTLFKDDINNDTIKYKAVIKEFGGRRFHKFKGNQDLAFIVIMSFKDNKIRLQATQFSGTFSRLEGFTSVEKKYEYSELNNEELFNQKDTFFQKIVTELQSKFYESMNSMCSSLEKEIVSSKSGDDW